MENQHTTLRNKYPDFLSLDELRRVLRVSPKSARYLVEHGIIPAIDTGKVTWRYKIDIEDVIAYMRIRAEAGSMIPPGAVSSRRKDRSQGASANRKSFSQLVPKGQERDVADYFEHIYADCDDVLTTNEIAEMTGLDRGSILALARQGAIKSIAEKPKYLIPKQYLLEFVATPRFLEARSNSPLFKKVLGGYEIWKAAKS